VVLLMADPSIVSHSERTSLGFEGRGLTYSAGPSIDQNHDDSRLAYAVRSSLPSCSLPGKRRCVVGHDDSRAACAWLPLLLCCKIVVLRTLYSLFAWLWSPYLPVQASCLIDMYPSVRVVVDLFELSSMKFMNQRFFDWSLPLTLWPPYASGSVFSGAMFDTMLCQVRHPARVSHDGYQSLRHTALSPPGAGIPSSRSPLAVSVDVLVFIALKFLHPCTPLVTYRRISTTR
jgi:hypothetical protein